MTPRFEPRNGRLPIPHLQVSLLSDPRADIPSTLHNLHGHFADPCKKIRGRVPFILAKVTSTIPAPRHPNETLMKGSVYVSVVIDFTSSPLSRRHDSRVQLSVTGHSSLSPFLDVTFVRPVKRVQSTRSLDTIKNSRSEGGLGLPSSSPLTSRPFYHSEDGDLRDKVPLRLDDAQVLEFTTPPTRTQGTNLQDVSLLILPVPVPTFYQTGEKTLHTTVTRPPDVIKNSQNESSDSSHPRPRHRQCFYPPTEKETLEVWSLSTLTVTELSSLPDQPTDGTPGSGQLKQTVPHRHRSGR